MLLACHRAQAAVAVVQHPSPKLELDGLMVWSSFTMLLAWHRAQAAGHAMEYPISVMTQLTSQVGAPLTMLLVWHRARQLDMQWAMQFWISNS